MKYLIFLILIIPLCICHSQYNCTSDLECNGLNYSYPTGICLFTWGSTIFGSCSCIYPCFQISLETHRCELNSCYEVTNLTNNGTVVCLPRSQSQMNISNLIFSIFLFSFGINQFTSNRWYFGIIQILFGLWLLFSYLINFIYYLYSKPYPDSSNLDRQYKYFCIFCCCQHSLITVIYLIWFCIDLILILTHLDISSIQCR